MKDSEINKGQYQSRLQESTLKLAYWTGTWVLTTALLAFGPKFIWGEAPLLTLGALALNIIVGIGMVISNKNHLETLDELERKITLDSLAIALGVGLIAGIPYELMEANNLIAFKAQIGHLIMLMGLTFLSSLYWSLRRYR